ncbi:hypothetical protein [Psychroflexus sp. ALD_RP9]|uniref:hypothetical protein n=1 Tax=Psychroflexus sp. ALD_RP9 TaxID=2777186 RepID=UPI001A90A15D|nr:hypothetical protein [Psychroflexus sp. ALD_RP9]QSS98025.1 hypothetical protein IMZ30_04740 [Psychroflexus sp. ALD_RP9]
MGKIGKGINRFLDIYILRPIFNYQAPNHFKNILLKKSIQGTNTDIKRENKYIVSLTSFPERITEVWISVMCLLNQTVKPDKIILWLAESQFKNEILPKSLKILQNYGLEIRFCDDLRSHKKYLYCLQQFPESYIMTFDDDLFYDNRVVENLIKLKKKYPNSIVANRCHKITFSKGNLKPYSNWYHNVIEKQPSYSLFHTSGGGVLFEKRLLCDTTFDKELIRKLSLNSDDVWLKIMSIKSNLKTVTNNRYNKDFVTVGTTQRISLVKSNTKKGMKDIQLKRVINYFNLSSKNFE